MNQENQGGSLADDRAERFEALARVFSPGAPIDQRDLFAGRLDQIRDVILTLRQKGQHVMLYGERGVGKTSLANFMQLMYERDTSSDFGCVTINCDVSDDFTSLWRKALRELAITVERAGFGFSRDDVEHETTSLQSFLPDKKLAPDDIRTVLAGLTKPVIIILDEIDTLPERETTAFLAHTVKSLSDHAIRSKLVLIGVADSVEELIAEHRSVERALVQVRMPRMSRGELFELLQKALRKVKMDIDQDAQNVIAQLSHGLPHYTHLLGLNAATQAVAQNRTTITLADVYAATSNVIEKASAYNQVTMSAYAKATRSTPRQNLHAKVLLACALTETDGLGTFAASDVREPLLSLTGKNYDLASYQRHLNDFSSDRRGPILKKLGSSGMFRYRFINPMLPPFVVIQGIRNKALQGDALEKFVLSRSKQEATTAPAASRFSTALE